MSLSKRADGRFIVKYKDDSGTWKQRSFRDKAIAEAFNAEQNAPEEELRLTMGELIVKYLHGNPDLFHETRERIIWLYADGGPCAFMRDKYADSLTRQDLERLRENMRARKASNTIPAITIRRTRGRFWRGELIRDCSCSIRGVTSRS